MSQVDNISMPVAVIPSGSFVSSIGTRVAASTPPIDPSRTPNETLVHKVDGSSVVEVTISLGAGRTNTYEVGGSPTTSSTPTRPGTIPGSDSSA
jgi:hypothetical protein